MLLGFDKVTSYYGKTPILKDMSFELPKGQCLCVLGRNGVGKTTLMRTIMGLTDKSTGSIRINGDEISGAPTHERAKYGIGYVPQGRGHIVELHGAREHPARHLRTQRRRLRHPRNLPAAVPLSQGEPRQARRAAVRRAEAAARHRAGARASDRRSSCWTSRPKASSRTS